VQYRSNHVAHVERPQVAGTLPGKIEKLADNPANALHILLGNRQQFPVDFTPGVDILNGQFQAVANRL